MTQTNKPSLSEIAVQGVGLTIFVIVALFAIRWGSETLRTVPSDDAGGNDSALVQETEAGTMDGVNGANSGGGMGEQAAAEIWLATNHILKNGQASQFQEVFALAQKIPPTSPLYGDAQEKIARWGSMILDIAEARALTGNYDGAIAAARLVPGDIPGVSAAAQEKLTQWQSSKQQYAQQQELFRQAKSMVVPGQASSYSEAIKLLRNIGPGDVGYGQAQALKNQWSRAIYLIANTRAAQGNFSSAIAAARLVPDDSGEYERAVKAIGRWQQGQR